MVFHLVLREDDWEIIAWKNSLGTHEFNAYVRAAIAAERKKKIAEFPVPAVLEKGDVFYDTKLYFNGRDEVTSIRTIPKKKRTLVIKKILLKHIRANQKRLADVKSKMPIVTEEQPVIQPRQGVLNKADGMSEEYRKMLNRMSGKT